MEIAEEGVGMLFDDFDDILVKQTLTIKIGARLSCGLASLRVSRRPRVMLLTPLSIEMVLIVEDGGFGPTDA